MERPFVFLNPGLLADGELRLHLAERAMPQEDLQAPYYRFEMRHAGTGQAMGRITLRISDQDFFRYYAGHIGYSVFPAFRGHHYASRSVRLLIPLAREHGLGELWITCNPENTASRRSCELAGAVYVETVPVPSWTEMYERGEREKCRYRLVS